MVTKNETILITGASSGLGLAFVKHYASQPSPTSPAIIALDAQPFPMATTTQNPTVHFHQLDITSTASIQALASTYASTPLSLIIHCAGIRGLVSSLMAHEQESGRRVVANAESIAAMDKDTMMKAFEVNTWGTFNLVQAFLPNLQLAGPSTFRPKVVVLSSRMSSITANTAGGGYAYRASKAALNAVVRSFVIDVPEVQFLLLHPGRVETGLVAWKEDGAVDVEESVSDCLGVIGRMDGEEWESGRLVDRFGVDIPW